MKRTLTLWSGVAALALLAWVTPSFAAQPGKDNEGKEVTIKGEGKCAKCSLKETEKCQNVIEREGKNGRKVKYYIVDNDMAKEFHKNICKETKKVTATGTVKKVDGKNEMTITKIEVVKE